PVTTGVNLSIYDDTTNVDGTPAPVDGIDYIYGGFNEDDNTSVSNNALTFNLTDKSVCCPINAGYSEFGNVTNNTITINSGTFDYCEIFGGCTIDGSATGNKIKINDGTFNGCNVYVGLSYSATCNVANNSLIISGGTFGGDSKIYGGNSVNGDAIGNELTITGGTFGENSKIYGGYAPDGNANNNTVEIFGGTFTDGFKLYGGYADDESKSMGNKLNLKIKMGGKAAEVGNFQEMNFTLPTNVLDNDKPMLSIDELYVDTFGGTATINVYAANGVKLNAGDRITLIKADTANDTFVAGAVLGGADVSKIIFLDENGTEIDPTTLDAFVGLQVILEMLKNYISGGFEDQQKAPVEAIAGSVAMINQSADLASGEAMASLQKETVAGFANTFGAITATRSKYQTGSHVDMDGWGFLVGAGTT
ncbi:MAG: hypothetical protein KBS60_03240, partial [Phascolarctobacterium sp.]|nr:hypothetical protein [Candidatus Phascolarctobacterium caballi]